MSPVLIAGFHRSGTSAVARMFHAAGLHLGNELLGAEPSNPYGHFEDVDVVALHDSILELTERTWKSTTAVPQPIEKNSAERLRTFIEQREQSQALWGVKDPRLCLFLSEWLSVVPDARVVVIFRRPDETIRSLHMRHAQRHVETRGVDPTDLDFWREPDLGLSLWVHYHRELLKALPLATQIHVVDFSDRSAVEDIVPTVDRRWHLDLDSSNLPALDAQLGHTSVAPIEVRSEALMDEATDIWRALQRLADQSKRA